MTLGLAITLGFILLLLVISAFFSGSETALTGASRARMHQLSKQGDSRAKTVLRLHEKKDRMIGAILLGNNLVNILASALATSLLLTFFGDAGVVYATLVMTVLVLIFAEVLPKSYALTNPDRLALKVAAPISAITFLVGPITLAIRAIIRATLRPFGVSLTTELDALHKEEELRGAIDLHEGEDPDIRQERVMLHSILDLDDVEVNEIMTHRRNVAMIDLDDPVQENVDKVLASPYTRIPIYRGDPDEIIGVLHAKALLREIRTRKVNLEEVDLEGLAAAPWFIPDTATLLDQLQAFRDRREHFAIVVDEYGSFMGIVTLEDIIEQIVGNIDDEHDVAVSGVRATSDGSFLVNGSVTLRTLHRDMDWNLPDEDASTIAGLVLHEARLIPEPGQVFIFYGFRFEIMRRQRNQITLIKVTPPAKSSDTQDGNI